jgi:hypothetical protein
MTVPVNQVEFHNRVRQRRREPAIILWSFVRPWSKNDGRGAPDWIRTGVCCIGRLVSPERSGASRVTVYGIPLADMNYYFALKLQTRTFSGASCVYTGILSMSLVPPIVAAASARMLLTGPSSWDSVAASRMAT